MDDDVVDSDVISRDEIVDEANKDDVINDDPRKKFVAAEFLPKGETPHKTPFVSVLSHPISS